MTHALTLEILAALLQSFLDAHRVSGSGLRFPVQPGSLLSMPWKEACRGRDGDAAFRDLQDMLSCAGRIAAPAPEEDAGRALRDLLGKWGSGPGTLVFKTSGSTGTPKRCIHPLEGILEETRFLAGLFHGVRSFLTTVPCHHIYGFTFSLLLPQFMNVPVRHIMPLPTVMKASMQPGDAVVSVPALWNACTFAQGDGEGMTAVVGGAPFSDERMRGLQQAGFAVLDIFGSTETSLAGTRNGPGPFSLPPHLACENGMFVRRRPDGSVLCVEPPDHLRWTDSRRFVLGGRIDHAVQVGGINVYPNLVASRLRAVEGVRDCIVRPMRENEGGRLKAFIVPEDGVDGAVLESRLRDCMKSELSSVERPVSLTFGERLPSNEMGKITDWQSAH